MQMIIKRCRGRERERRMEELLLSKPSILPAAFCRDEGKRCNGKAFSSSLAARENKLVCVTDGNSFLGSHLVKELLACGYLVRITIQNQGDFEGMKGLINDEDMNKLESVVVAKMQDLDSLCDAFRGCHAVFHTSSFIDPHGISGYSEKMAFLESEGARNVIEACGRAAYIRRCIFTSSLLASIWSSSNFDRPVDETCWSSEEYCRENKLWLALGKLRAEKMAWRKSKELKVNLVTVCPCLLMPKSSPHDHRETSLPYLKGGSIMLQNGLLAIADVKKAAEAHVRVYEAMDSGAAGRYHCFQRVIQRFDEAVALENELKVQGLLSSGRTSSGALLAEEEDQEIEIEILNSNVSNSKLSRLLIQASDQIACRAIKRQ